VPDVSAGSFSTSIATPSCCCGSGCGCSASESPSQHQSPSLPASTQSHETRFNADVIASLIVLALPFENPLQISPAAAPERQTTLPLYRQHCSWRC
jgi:hypothetical protein